MDKVLHLIVSRVALRWNHRNLKDWDSYVKDRLVLYRNYTLSSLINQSSQDFTLLSLVDESIHLEPTLENEVVLKTNLEVGSNKLLVPNMVQEYVSGLNEKYDYVIVTRLDSDDMISKNFIEEVRKNIKLNEYYDIYDTFIYDFSKKIIYESGLYNHTISHFVSVMEKFDSFDCQVYRHEHTNIRSFFKGYKSKTINGLEIIHGKNMINSIKGNKTNKVKLEDYGNINDCI